MGLMEVASLIGGAAAPWAVQWMRIVHKRLPFLLIGGVTIIASFLCFFLKETNGKESAELLNTVKPVGGIKHLFFVYVCIKFVKKCRWKDEFFYGSVQESGCEGQSMPS